MVSATKLSKAEAGAIGARRRWGAPRVLRLDQLHPAVAAAVRALVDADANMKKSSTVSETPAELQEVIGADRDLQRAS